MKPVVIYYSFTGNNRHLAMALQRRLGCDCIELRERRPRTRFTILLDIVFDRMPQLNWAPRDLGQYDQAVLVAPIWAGRIAAPMAAFIAQQKGALPPIAFIALCSGAPEQALKIAGQLQRLTGQAPAAVSQLNVNDLLPPRQKNRVRYASAYRVSEPDMHAFDEELDAFVRKLQGAVPAA